MSRFNEVRTDELVQESAFDRRPHDEMYDL
jgi:hypothetical protein